MESILWLPLTDYHHLSSICHVISRISFLFYITCEKQNKIKNLLISSTDVERVNLLAWKANVTVIFFLLQSASAKR